MFATRPVHIVDLVFRIIGQLIARAEDLDIARQARDRDGGIGVGNAALLALGSALVVKDLGVEGDFELQGCGKRTA